MSGPIHPLCSSDQLRRSFAIWSLAIFGSLTTSGSVRLESSVWGADDPPVGTKADENAQPKAAADNTEKKDAEKKDAEKSDADKSAAQGAPSALTRQAFLKLLQAKKFEEAGQLVDEALAKQVEGSNLYNSYLLSSYQLQTDAQAAKARLENVVKLSAQLIESGNDSETTRTVFAMSHQALAMSLDRDGKTDESLESIKKALVVLSKLPNADQLTPAFTSLQARMLVKSGRIEEARAVIEESVQAAFALVKERSDSTTRRALGTAVSNYNSTLGTKVPDDVRKAYTAAETILREAVDAESSTFNDFSAYQNLQNNMAMSLADTDASAAMAMIEGLETLGAKLADRWDDSDQSRWKSAQSLLSQTARRIKSKLLHQSLLGQPAPEFDIEEVVNMQRVSWPDLKGKVVLIDFWAVWCGPCIATFPHLQHLQQTYADSGLVIVGVTRQYGYTWDKEAGKQISKKDATLAEELEMLEEFRKSHKLEHGFVVTPAGSEYGSKFGVTGIPQAVLVDQDGKIAMIRVGSGAENSKALEEKIRSLMGLETGSK
ncbi:MAG: redoxin family protein [Pirellulaceae bacterium]|nr:redoxin family protein [Pirellulaceae bacterium]